jgi:hypothetical protein
MKIFLLFIVWQRAIRPRRNLIVNDVLSNDKEAVFILKGFVYFDDLWVIKGSENGILIDDICW